MDKVGVVLDYLHPPPPHSSSRLLRLDGASAEVWQLATRATRPALGARALRSAKEKGGRVGGEGVVYPVGMESVV